MGTISKIIVVLIQMFSLIGGIGFLWGAFAIVVNPKELPDGLLTPSGLPNIVIILLMLIASILCFGLYSMIALFDGAVAEMQKSLSPLLKITENTKRADAAPVNDDAQKAQNDAGSSGE